MNSNKLVLASSSSFRQEQLKSLGFEFEIDVSNVDETRQPKEPPSDLSLRLAKLKAEVVGARHENAVIIGADQVAEVNGEILDKPGSEARANSMLAILSEQQACFYSAVSVWQGTNEIESFIESTIIQFRKLTTNEIERYVHLDQPLNCAGAIKSESRGSLLFERISSNDPTALIGLPLIKLAAVLRNVGFDPLS